MKLFGSFTADKEPRRSKARGLLKLSDTQVKLPGPQESPNQRKERRGLLWRKRWGGGENAHVSVEGCYNRKIVLTGRGMKKKNKRGHRLAEVREDTKLAKARPFTGIAWGRVG